MLKLEKNGKDILLRNIHPSIHYLSKPVHQGLTQRDKQSYTPTWNLESPVHPVHLACLWTMGGAEPEHLMGTHAVTGKKTTHPRWESNHHREAAVA